MVKRQKSESRIIMLNYILPLIIATFGWVFTGYSAIAMKRVDYINPFFIRADVRAFGFFVAIVGTICAFFFSHWWWGLVVSFCAPNIAAVFIMAINPRPS